MGDVKSEATKFIFLYVTVYDIISQLPCNALTFSHKKVMKQLPCNVLNFSSPCSTQFSKKGSNKCKDIRYKDTTLGSQGHNKKTMISVKTHQATDPMTDSRPLIIFYKLC